MARQKSKAATKGKGKGKSGKAPSGGLMGFLARLLPGGKGKAKPAKGKKRRDADAASVAEDAGWSDEETSLAAEAGWDTSDSSWGGEANWGDSADAWTPAGEGGGGAPAADWADAGPMGQDWLSGSSAPTDAAPTEAPADDGWGASSSWEQAPGPAPQMAVPAPAPAPRQPEDAAASDPNKLFPDGVDASLDSLFDSFEPQPAAVAAQPEEPVSSPAADLMGEFMGMLPGAADTTSVVADAPVVDGWQDAAPAADADWQAPPEAADGVWQAPAEGTDAGWQPPADGGWQAPAEGADAGWQPPADGGWQAPAEGADAGWQPPADGGWQAPAEGADAGWQPPADGGWQAPAEGADAGWQPPADGGWQAPVAGADAGWQAPVAPEAAYLPPLEAVVPEAPLLPPSPPPVAPEPPKAALGVPAPPAGIPEPPRPEGLVSVGKMLVDQNQLKKIIDRGEGGDGRTRLITSARGEELDQMLQRIQAVRGASGALIVGRDGLVISAQLSSDHDREMLGAIASSMFANLEVQVRKMQVGKLGWAMMDCSEGSLMIVGLEIGVLVVLAEGVAELDIGGVWEVIATRDT
ncbi:MAG: roadblock/LC7 domain-containing protein [Candidatus Sericytochromatia bacterium]|nr:roadblock/LC7 domain-containing protein [Candidatus Tanganyikabacteria bacterium]